MSHAMPAVPSVRLACGFLCLVALALFGLRLAGPPELVDNEYRVGACVMNAVEGGNWLCPHDSLGNTDKPPMLTWLSALVTLATGLVDRFTLYLPTALAVTVTASLIVVSGGRQFGGWAGALGGLAYLLSNIGARQMGTARWDGIFSFTVMLCALAAFRAWTTGRGWTAFWFAAAISTLTKGPLGPFLAALGLVAVPWERRSGHPAPLRGHHLTGVVLYLLVAGGWFALAYHQVGPHLLDTMLRSEFVGHLVVHEPAHRFWKPLIDFLGNFAPWSLATVVGLWRVFRRPAIDDDERRFERFCAGWFGLGLLVFCLSPHNPSRLMYPVIPAAALLAGRELARATRAWSGAQLRATCLAATVVALGVFEVQYHFFESQHREVQETLAMQGLAATIGSTVGADFPLAFTNDTSFAIQLCLHVMRPTVPGPTAAALLRGDDPAFVVVADLPRLRGLVGDAVTLHEIVSAPAHNAPYLHLVSNRERLAAADPIATALGSLVLRLEGVRLVSTQDGVIAVARTRPGAALTITNQGHDPQAVAVRVDGAPPHLLETRQLASGEQWRVMVP